MAKGVPFKITISQQSIALLEFLASKGIYGRNAPEVAGRFVDKALEAFVDQPRFVFQQGEPQEKGGEGGAQEK